jgi:hypothetical protein
MLHELIIGHFRYGLSSSFDQISACLGHQHFSPLDTAPIARLRDPAAG